ncbi:MAG: anti-sigma factor [Deltaproteobacteria bacterium]
MGKRKTCRYFCEHLSDYLDGLMEANECRLLEMHLAECPPCRLIYQSLELTVSLCGQGISDEVPEGVKQRLKQFLREHCQEDVLK